MKAIDIARFIEEGVNDGTKYSDWDGGFLHGTPDDEISSVAITWKPLSPVLSEIHSRKFDMIICHEGPWIGPGELYAGPWEDETVSKTPEPDLRLNKIIHDAGMTLFMCHYGLDKLVIFDEFTKVLGAGTPVSGKGYSRVYSMEALTVEELGQKIKKLFNLDFVRITGKIDKKVSRPGFLFGGTALNNISKLTIPLIIKNGADVLIAGEMDEFTTHNAFEHGLPLIECGHAVSETPGLIKFTEMLRKNFPELRIEFFDTPKLINII